MTQITIAGRAFEVSAPYAAGHTLTEGEASQLNQVRHENIRNNFAKKVKDAPEGADLQGEIEKYDSEYVMGVRRASGTAPTRDPVVTVARRIARDSIKTALKNAGQTKTAEEIAAAVEKAIAANPKIMELAQDEVERTRAAAASINVEI